MTPDEWLASLEPNENAIASEDVDVLAEFASRVPRNGLIIEIGAFKGHSTGVLLIASRENKPYVVTIDPFWTENEGYFAQEFWANIQKLPRSDVKRLVPIGGKTKTIEHFWRDAECDLLFVDGEHQARSVQDDLEVWGWYCPVILCHDYYEYQNSEPKEKVFENGAHVAQGVRGFTRFLQGWERTRPNPVSSIACLRRKYMDDYEQLQDFVKRGQMMNEEMAKGSTPDISQWPKTSRFSGLDIWPEPDKMPPGVRNTNMTCDNKECPYYKERGEFWVGQGWLVLQKKNKLAGTVQAARRQFFLMECPHCGNQHLPE